ncbi:ABC transporter transmembrane domain-containing protein [Clostridium felsineum]|uniref:ABC transporter transmembrane domain-containing protein n=1 Tax=Clostridium felsineum TaxID=36839 RepID=UPI0011154E2F|nr:ABC transporter transmembrane domain-containing protein [Clostridium felsineum]
MKNKKMVRYKYCVIVGYGIQNIILSITSNSLLIIILIMIPLFIILSCKFGNKLKVYSKNVQDSKDRLQDYVIENVIRKFFIQIYRILSEQYKTSCNYNDDLKRSNIKLT